jgi:hypothetical protein
VIVKVTRMMSGAFFMLSNCVFVGFLCFERANCAKKVVLPSRLDCYSFAVFDGWAEISSLGRSSSAGAFRFRRCSLLMRENQVMVNARQSCESGRGGFREPHFAA